MGKTSNYVSTHLFSFLKDTGIANMIKNTVLEIIIRRGGGGREMKSLPSTSAAISLRLQGKLSFPYNCQKMNGQIYVLLC